MPLAGRQLGIGWALALCRHVGFKGRDLQVAVALMTAESGRYAGAWHDNLAEDHETVLSTDRGLFQINNYWHKDLSEDDAYSAIPNAEYAFKMSSGKNFGAWAAYNSGAYEQYMDEVGLVKDAGKWREKVDQVEARFPRGLRT